MKINCLYIIIILFLSTTSVFSQKDERKEKSKEVEVEEDLTIKAEKVAAVKKKRKNIKNKKEVPYEPLAPARAAFYSAILPGLGQAYTKKYWKIPIVYAAIGGGIYAYKWNNDRYNLFRDAYKRRLAGFTDDRFFGELDADGNPTGFSNDQLIDRQRRFRRDQEFALLLTAAAWVLNVVDANVSAHLQQFNINDDLSFKPKILIDEHTSQPSYGVSLNLNF